MNRALIPLFSDDAPQEWPRLSVFASSTKKRPPATNVPGGHLGNPKQAANVDRSQPRLRAGDQRFEHRPVVKINHVVERCNVRTIARNVDGDVFTKALHESAHVGKVEVTVGDETGIVEAPTLALVPTLAPHNLRNVGDVPVKFAGFFPSRYIVSVFDNEWQPDGTNIVDTAQIEQMLAAAAE